MTFFQVAVDGESIKITSARMLGRRHKLATLWVERAAALREAVQNEANVIRLSDVTGIDRAERIVIPERISPECRARGQFVCNKGSLAFR